MYVENTNVLGDGIGSIKMVLTWGSEPLIIESARMSTQKGFLGWGPLHYDGCERKKALDESPFKPPFNEAAVHEACTCANDKPGDEKLLRHLWENQHHTPFEMVGATFEVKAPIFVFREWHRHRVPHSYNEMSARYTALPDENYIPTIERLMINASTTNKQAGTIAGAEQLTEENALLFQRALRHEYTRQEDLYQQALHAGVPKEVARAVIPVGRYSVMRASSNLRGWVNFLSLRAHHAAQWEIRQYAYEVEKMLGTTFPRTMELFAELKAKRAEQR